MSKAPGTAGTIPVTGAACGVRPSKEAMEVAFSVDFSKAVEFLPEPNQTTADNNASLPKHNPSQEPLA